MRAAIVRRLIAEWAQAGYLLMGWRLDSAADHLEWLAERVRKEAEKVETT